MMLDMTRGRPSTKPRSPFGRKLVAARERAGLTQAQLAARLGVTQRAVAHWERTSTSLKPEQIEAMAEALKIGVGELICDKPKRQRGKTGPEGKARKLFNKVSKLPKAQQQHVLSVVEAFVERHS